MLDRMNRALKPMRDKAKVMQKDIVAISETLGQFAKKTVEDEREEKKNILATQAITRKIKKVDMTNNIRNIDFAFLDMLNYELYKKAIEYKQREADERKKQHQSEQEAALQRKIDDKLTHIEELRRQNQQRTDLLSKSNAEAEYLVKACSGKLEDLSLYRNNLEYLVFTVIIR